MPPQHPPTTTTQLSNHKSSVLSSPLPISFHSNFESQFIVYETLKTVTTNNTITTTRWSPAMAMRINNSLLLFLLLLIYFLLSSGIAQGFRDNKNPVYSLHKDCAKMNSRKLLVVDAVLDYDYTGPNPKHDQRKGKPGNGGKNP